MDIAAVDISRQKRQWIGPWKARRRHCSLAMFFRRWSADLESRKSFLIALLVFVRKLQDRRRLIVGFGRLREKADQATQWLRARGKLQCRWTKQVLFKAWHTWGGRARYLGELNRKCSRKFDLVADIGAMQRTWSGLPPGLYSDGIAVVWARASAVD